MRSVRSRTSRGSSSTLKDTIAGSAAPIEKPIWCGAHSLSELDWNSFCDYFENVVCKAPALFYAHRSRPSTELVDTKLDLIRQRFKQDGCCLSETNILFRSKWGGAQEEPFHMACFARTT